MTRSNAAKVERLPIPDCVQAVIDRQKAKLREKAIARLRQEREEAARHTPKVIPFPSPIQPEGPITADNPNEATNLPEVFPSLVEDSEGISEDASKQPIGGVAGTATEALSAEKRQLWETDAPILLPTDNGQIAVCRPLALETLTASLINCQSPTELKILRETYPLRVLNYVLASKLDIEAQKRIKGWADVSQPEKEPLHYELIRTPELGEKWFQIEVKSAKPETKLQEKYRLVTDAQALTEALTPLEVSKVLGIDTETTGLDPHLHQVRLLQIAADNQPVVIVDLSAISPSDRQPLSKLLTGPAIKVGHNLKFDLKFLAKAGLKPTGPLFDTMLAAQLLSAGLPGRKHSLAVIAKEYLGEDLPKEQQASDWTGELTSEQLEYAARDSAILLRLREALKTQLVEAELVQAAKLEFETLPAVVDMELNGMLLNLDKWKILGREMEAAKAKAGKELQELLQRGMSLQPNLFGQVEAINLDSNQQVLSALRSQEIPLDTTDKKALIPLATQYPAVKALLEYRKHSKSVSAFGSALPKRINSVTGRLHPDYWQCGAATGRFSCTGPNLQQIPREKTVRDCFIPSPGYRLVVADYSQIELRVAAEISRDKRMIEAYQNGEDLHRLTASLVAAKPLDQVTKEERQAAKAVNFGLIYAMGAWRLQQEAQNTYGVKMTLKQAETFRKRFFQGYKGLAQWHNKVGAEAIAEARTLSGRRRQWTEKPNLQGLLNSPVQGTSADITKKALALLPKALEGTQARIIGTVHDEILLEVPEATADQAAQILREVMEVAGREYLTLLPVEAEARVVNSWAEK